MKKFALSLLAVAALALIWRGSGVDALRLQSGSKQFVCTETFRASLTSFFVQKDTKVAFAEDTNELCELCAKVTRLAYLYSNDVQTQSKWPAALKDNACTFVSTARKADCSSLTDAVVSAKRSFFDSKKSKFTRTELRGSTEQLALLVDNRSYLACKHIGCCPINSSAPNAKSKSAKAAKTLTPCSVPGDKAGVAADRASLSKDKFYLDSLREQLFVQRRQNNEFKAKLDLREVDLKTREDRLKKGQNVLKTDKQKLREASNSLKVREARVKRRESDEKEFERYNKKQEKWLKERSDLVKDREDICYKREEQLGLPHPPKTRPPPSPPAPVPPPSRPPSS